MDGQNDGCDLSRNVPETDLKDPTQHNYWLYHMLGREKKRKEKADRQSRESCGAAWLALCLVQRQLPAYLCHMRR